LSGAQRRPLLLLFDIDGTLVRRAGAAHRRAIEVALARVHGVEGADVSRAEPAGRTDLEIVRRLALAHGVPAECIDERMDDVREAACETYARTAEEDLSANVLPGVFELLADLRGRDDVRLALLTGNFEPIARLKLARAGIGGFFSPWAGGFGSDAEDRAELPALARARAGGADGPWPRRRALVIGDTPRDIACARADGIGVICAATGPYPVEDLEGADAVAASAPELAPLIDARARAG